jgi:hypothetical protein
VNTLQGISLLQSPDTLILLHLTRANAVLQLDQLVLKAAKVILVPPISTYLSLDREITKGLEAQVHLVPIGVAGAEEPYVSYGVSWALTEVKEGGRIEMIGIWGGAAGAEAVDSGVISELHLGELRRPDTSIRSSDGHRYILCA